MVKQFTFSTKTNLEMSSKVLRLCNGCTLKLTIPALMGMAGGAYLYVYKQKGASNPPRIPDSNPDSTTKKLRWLKICLKNQFPIPLTIFTRGQKELNGPGEDNTKWQEVWGTDGKNYYICPVDVMAGAEYRTGIRAAQNQKDLI